MVARDLQTAHYAGGIVGRLQVALEDWGFFGPQLQDLYDALNAGQARYAFPFEPARCLAPLPRSALCVAGQAYAAPGEEGDPTAAPTLAAGTALRGPRGQIVWPDGQPAPDFGATLLALTGDVPLWATAEQALDGVRLLALAVQIDTAPAVRGAGPRPSSPRPTPPRSFRSPRSPPGLSSPGGVTFGSADAATRLVRRRIARIRAASSRGVQGLGT